VPDMPSVALPSTSPTRPIPFWLLTLTLWLTFLALGIVLHTPPPAGAPGLLAAQPPGFLAALNPIPWLAQHLSLSNQTTLRLVLILLLLLSFWLYRLALRRARHSPRPLLGLPGLVVGLLLLSLPLVLAPHLFSRDVYYYIVAGRMTALYGANPSIATPAMFPQDPFLPQVAAIWQDRPSDYGPVWTIASHATTLIGEALGGQPWHYLLSYKLLALSAHLFSTMLLWRLLGQLRPQQQVWGTLLYAWNPLALIEFAGNAHNEAVMLAFLLLGLWLACNQHWRLATLAMVAASLVKWIPLLILALYLLSLLRRQPTWPARLIRAAQLVPLLLLPPLVLVAPYPQGWQSLPQLLLVPSASLAVNSLHALLLHALPMLLSRLGFNAITWQAVAASLIQHGTRLIAVLAWLVALAATWRHPTLDRLIQHGFWLLFVILLFAAALFWPWYVTWILPLAALLPWRTSGQLAVSASTTAVLLYPTLPDWGAATPTPLILGLRPLLVFPPIMLLLAYLLWQQRAPLPRPWRKPLLAPSLPASE
jgi:hypothetical protein